PISATIAGLDGTSEAHANHGRALADRRRVPRELQLRGSVSLSLGAAQRARRRNGATDRGSLRCTPGLPHRARSGGAARPRRPPCPPRSARIGDHLEVEIEGIEGRQPDTETWIDNVRHPVSTRLAAARAVRMSYRDHGLNWNHTGRNGHYSAFVWSGP